MQTKNLTPKFKGLDGLLWAVVLSVVVVTVAAAIGKATINVTGSVLDAHQPLTVDVVDALLPTHDVREIEILREDTEGVHLQIYTDDNVVWGIAQQNNYGWRMEDWSVMHR